IRYIIDMAEIPTLDEKRRIDRDGDGRISAEEQQAYLAGQVPALVSRLTLLVNDRPLSLPPGTGTLEFLPGAAGLETMLICVDLEVSLAPGGQPVTVAFRDGNYEPRAGWKEIVARAGPGVTLRHASVPSVARSQELTVSPPDVVPPQDTEASFT